MKQKEFIGPGCIEKVKDIIDEIGATKVLVVTGNKSYDSSGAKNKLERILKGVYIEKFDQFEINPKIEHAYGGIEILSNTKFDLIIAVGGGSVIDMAKLINIIAVQKKSDLLQYINNNELIIENGLPLVAIPTTLGTGSEATHFSVVYIDKVKYSLAHHYMLPTYAILDAELSYNLPSHIAAASAIDALSQSIESYWAIKSTHESREYAAASIKLILPVIEKAVLGDKQSREIMLKAAHLAGKAINISTTTAPHAISYPISQYFGLQHGHAVALTLGYFLEFNYECSKIDVVDVRGKAHLKNVMDELYSMFGVTKRNGILSIWKNIMQNIGLETSFKKNNIIDHSDRKCIVDGIDLRRLENNPVKVDSNTIYNILRR